MVQGTRVRLQNDRAGSSAVEETLLYSDNPFALSLSCPPLFSHFSRGYHLLISIFLFRCYRLWIAYGFITEEVQYFVLQKQEEEY